MPLDQVENFVEVNVAGDHNSTETTISLQSGEASNLPDPANGEYNLVWFNPTNFSRPSDDANVEIVRVTARDTNNDTITVQRGQENTTAVAHNISNSDYVMILAYTAKTVEDIDAANFETNSLTVAGNSVTLGQSTAINHADLSNIGTADHHTRYTDEESQDAFGSMLTGQQSLINVTYDDANNQVDFVVQESNIDHDSLTGFVSNEHINHNNVDITAGTHLTGGGDLTASMTLNVDETGIDATNLDGSAGTSGQFLQTDGTNLSFADITGGMTDSERQAFNDLVAQLARNDFADNLSDLNYDGGLYAIWKDLTKVGSQNQVNIQTLQDGDNNGVVELDTTNWVLSAATYSGTSISTQDGTPSGLFWKSDGTKLYEIGYNTDLIYEYSVSTAWDLSTASFNTSISTQDSAALGLFWKPDGTKLYELGTGSDLIYEYSVSTAWDLNTASYTGTSISTQDSAPSGLFWKSDGTKLYELGYNSGLIYEYSVSTAWDLNTATYSGTSISTQDSSPSGLFWKSDGTKLYEIGNGSNLIYEYSVSTAWDLSTASFNTSISTQDGAPRGLFWKGDGTKMYEIGQGSDLIYEYNVGNNQGLFSSGSVSLVSKDLGVSENGGFTSAPTSLVLSQSVVLDAGEDIQYVVSDGNGNSVTVTQADVDSEVDCSNFTSTVVDVSVELSQTSGTTPTSDDVMVHFKE